MAAAGVPGIEVGEDGIVKSGRFVGHHINDVLEYVDHLERAAGETAAAPQAAAPPAAPAVPSPREALEQKAGARVDNINLMAQATAVRLEQDDEEGFAATVSDYEQYRGKIAEIKKTSQPALRTQRGYHKQAYLFLKSQDPAVARQLLGQPPLEVPEEEEPATEEAPAAPVEVPPVAPPAAPVRKPQAVPPPSAKATPGARSTPPAAVKQPRLTATPKLAQMAAGMGMSTEAYLVKLEAEGVTQETINAMSQGQLNGTPGGRRRTVFDSNV
jgi:hypothetical protein